MATTAYNNIVRSVAPKSIFESAKDVLSTTNDWNQGDLLAFDTTAKVIKAVTATADAQFILGVAKNTVVDGKVKSPYQGTAVDAAAAYEDIAGPVYGVIVELTMKTGDAFAHGDKIYVTTTDAQTITVTDPGDHYHIGVYQGKTVASAAAGQKGLFLIGARYGSEALQF